MSTQPAITIAGAENAHQSFKDSFSYSSYLRLEQLLAAQQPLTDAHDEVLFITIHHVQEVWMSLIIKEITGAMAKLTAGDFEPAMKMLARVSRAQEQMGAAWEVLKTMTPADYLEFRSAFGKASGFQSWQYRCIEFAMGNKNAAMLRPHAHRSDLHGIVQSAYESPSLYDECLRLLARRGLAVPESHTLRDWREPYTASTEVEQAWLAVYRDPKSHWDLYQLGEELTDLEDAFRLWRFRHLTTVERVIGFKRGTGGTGGISYLRKMLDVVLFPEIWALRTDL